jgi:hypothetical protein
MKRIFLLTAVLLFAAAAAEAQHMPPGKWWRRPEIITELNLTADQQEKLDEVFRNAANDLIDAKAAVDKLQIALRGEIDRPQLRRGDIQRVVADLNVARGRLFEREMMMLVDMRSVLNESQWNRMRQRLDQLEERNRPMDGRRPQPGNPPMRRPGAGRRQ